MGKKKKKKKQCRAPNKCDPEVRAPSGVDVSKGKNYFEMCFPLWTGRHLHCLPMQVTLNALLVAFQTKWLC